MYAATASAASSSVAKPSGCARMKPRMRSTPSGSTRGAMSTSTTADAGGSGLSPCASRMARPPSDAPTIAGRIGKCFAMLVTSRASASAPYSPSGSQLLSPWPRRSSATAWWPTSASAAAVSPHACRVWPPPCRSRTGRSAGSPYASPTIRSGPTSKTTVRGSATGNTRLTVGKGACEHVGDPAMEAVTEMIRRLGEEVAGARQHLELTASRQRLHRLARHHRQELVAIAVQEEERALERSGTLAPGRLRGQRHHAGGHRTQRDPGVDGHRATEGMSDEHEAPAAVAMRQIGRGGEVQNAGGEVVGTAVADPDGADTFRRERLPECVEEAVARPEQAAHGAAAHHDHALVARVAVPQEGEQALERVRLDVAQPRRHQDVLLGEHPQAIEWALARGVGAHGTAACRGGRRFAQGRASSSWAATRSRRSSPSYGATSWIPTGRPSGVQCSGSEMAGWPVVLKGSVKAAKAVALKPVTSGSTGSGRNVPSSGGGSGSVGVTRRSKPLSHHAAMRRV